jgi:hypothetical protein
MSFPHKRPRLSPPDRRRAQLQRFMVSQVPLLGEIRLVVDFRAAEHVVLAVVRALI